MTEAIHPPLDHLSLPRRERFESFSDFFGATFPPDISNVAPSIAKDASNAKKGDRSRPFWENGVPPSKENDHLAMAVVMMVVVPPPMLLEMVMMMVVMEAVSRGRLDGAGERAGGDENGDEA
ncbi:hypothetical protein OOJ09_14565 [Mesorhizobium qingshengii]|uniref:Uncharacterized protein n=1 Tax=Mesorhizobium qingshengii TaxID=1165689 RepID=A0ABT4QV22_9HYPH|nr:hypothetical protein [Mesorhizobium qingshengii]MCZ8545412.1 hypothetical protein [Mesorhizobium qingshengii]